MGQQLHLKKSDGARNMSSQTIRDLLVRQMFLEEKTRINSKVVALFNGKKCDSKTYVIIIQIYPKGFRADIKICHLEEVRHGISSN